MRNLDDMETMSIPLKYRQIMTFWKYYSGEKVAPIPTIFSEYKAPSVHIHAHRVQPTARGPVNPM